MPGTEPNQPLTHPKGEQCHTAPDSGLALDQPIQRLPDDFCRSCYGKGWVDEPGDRPGVTVSTTCHSCNGTGWGK